MVIRFQNRRNRPDCRLAAASGRPSGARTLREQALGAVIEGSTLDAREKGQAQFFASLVTDALAPSNWPGQQEAEEAAPKQLGSRKFKPLGPAPGTYVMAR